MSGRRGKRYFMERELPALIPKVATWHFLQNSLTLNAFNSPPSVSFVAFSLAGSRLATGVERQDGGTQKWHQLRAILDTRLWRASTPPRIRKRHASSDRRCLRRRQRAAKKRRVGTT